MKYTVLLMEGRTPKRCIGIFSSKLEATTWALSDGWYRMLKMANYSRDVRWAKL